MRASLGAFYYNVLDKSGMMVQGGAAISENNVPINTLEEYNKSVLGPLQIPVGGRLLTFPTATAQKAFVDDYTKRMLRGETQTAAIQAALSTSAGMSTTTKLLIGAGALVALYFMVKR